MRKVRSINGKATGSKKKAKAKTVVVTTRGDTGRYSPMPQQIPPMVRDHVRMLVDPCSSDLSRSCYAGYSGIITRHTQTSVFTGTGTNSALTFGFHPGGLRLFVNEGTNGASSITVAYQTGGVPGYDFLASVAGQQRCVAACVRVNWVGTELNRQGELGLGVVSGETVGSGATTINSIHNLLPVKKRVPDGAVELRWNPASEDESYGSTADPVGDHFNEKNMMVMTYVGGTAWSFSVTCTAIYEWTPRVGQGQPTPPTVRVSTPAAVTTINNVLAKIAGGAHTFSVTAESASNTITALYNAGRVGAKLVTGLMAA